jgi:hypothetical protein
MMDWFEKQQLTSRLNDLEYAQRRQRQEQQARMYTPSYSGSGSGSRSSGVAWLLVIAIVIVVSIFSPKDNAANVPTDTQPVISALANTNRYSVVNVNSRLGLRDKSSWSNGKVVVWLTNGITLISLGETQEGDVENGDTETWVKVQTEDGEIGWTRLTYLKKI